VFSGFDLCFKFSFRQSIPTVTTHIVFVEQFLKLNLGTDFALFFATTFRLRPTCAAEASRLTFGFSSNGKMIDNFHRPEIFLRAENKLL
jgi:hypothetical protein